MLVSTAQSLRQEKLKDERGKKCRLSIVIYSRSSRHVFFYCMLYNQNVMCPVVEDVRRGRLAHAVWYLLLAQ